MTTPIGGGFSSINVALRKQFELFANFRPIRNLPSVATRYPDVDLVIVRENTEGLYSGIEHEVVPGVVESLKIITEKASTRISSFAFEYARKHNRKKIHAIHKANIMKLSDGLFIRCSRNISKEYPEITYGEHIVDNTCMQLVMNPYQYDTLLLENLYGDIISDLCAAFVGGLGLVPGANFGHECAIFEAVHGSAPDIAGKDIANPTAVLRSGILMLRHLGEENAANHIRLALEKVYGEKKHIDARRRRHRGHQRVRRRHGRGAAYHSAAEAGVAGSGVVEALQQVGPSLAALKDRDQFDAFATNAIWDDVRGSWHDQLTHACLSGPDGQDCG